MLAIVTSLHHLPITFLRGHKYYIPSYLQARCVSCRQRPPSCSTSPSSLLPSPRSLSLALLASLASLLPSSSSSLLVVVVLVVLLSCQSKEFDQSKPRRYHPWHGDGSPPLGFSVGWLTALLGRHLVKNVILSEISWC